jgi:hypothetical protein
VCTGDCWASLTLGNRKFCTLVCRYVFNIYYYIIYSLLLLDVCRSEIPWLGCGSKITPAKRKVVDAIVTMCEMQRTANAKYQPFNSSTAGQVQMESSAGMVGPDSWQELFKLSISTARGIIYTGSYKHLQQIFQSILALRLLKTKLPVEIWVAKRDMKYCNAMLSIATNIPNIVLSEGASCKQLPDIVGGYSHKFYAMLSTSLSDVIFLDADNIPLRNVEEIFDSEEYQRTGAVLWPDRCGARCKGVISDNGYTAFADHVLYTAGIGGLIYNASDRYYTQEAESGQMAFSIRRHGPIIELGRKLMEDIDFFSRVVRGDKDIWRVAFLMAGEQFHFVDKPIGVSYSLHGKQRDCLAQYFGKDDANPMFCHQSKVRDMDSLTIILRVPVNRRKDGSHCITLRVLNEDFKVTSDDPTAETRQSINKLLSTHNASHSVVRSPPEKLKTVLLNSHVLVVPESKLKPKNSTGSSSRSAVIRMSEQVADKNISKSSRRMLSETENKNVSTPASSPATSLRGRNASAVQGNVLAKNNNSSSRIRATNSSLSRGRDRQKRFTFKVQPRFSKREVERRTNVKVDTVRLLTKAARGPTYKTPSSLILERPPEALQMGEFRAQVYNTADEAWFKMERKSELTLFWESFNARFALVFRNLFHV